MRAHFIFNLFAAGHLIASTLYVGDALDHRLSKLVVDANGYTYVTGARYIAGTADVYVIKYDPAGNPVAKATFSGKGHDRATALAVDRQGYVYLAGLTTSANWPLQSALQPDPSTRGASAFVMKLSPGLDQVVYSTYFGGRLGETTPNALAVDSLGNLHVAGHTTAPDFPVTAGLPAGTVTPNIAGVYGAFLTKLSSSGDRVVWSALVSGNAVACTGGSSCFLSTRMTTAYGVALDPSGNACAGGYTNVTDLPATPGAFREKGIGAFVFQVKADGSGLGFLTHLSSRVYVAGSFASPGSSLKSIAMDPSGNIVLAGYTTDPQFPVTPGALQSTLWGNPETNPFTPPPADVFLAALRPDGRSLAWSTYFGRSWDDFLDSAALDSGGRVWFAGRTSSPDFPNANSWASGEEYVASLDPVAMRVEYAARFPNGSVAQSLAHGPGSLLTLGGERGLLTRFIPGQVEPGLFHLTNAAGWQIATRIAPGEIISLYGPSIGGGGVTEVYINNVAATVLYSGPNQINAIVPPSLSPPSTAGIRLRRDGVEVPAYRVGLVHAAPEIFRTSAGEALLHVDGTWNSQSNPARPGDVVSLWISGASAGVPPTVTVGNLEAEILYYGSLQINFRIPQTPYTVDNVTVHSAGASSQAVPIYLRP